MIEYIKEKISNLAQKVLMSNFIVFAICVVGLGFILYIFDLVNLIHLPSSYSGEYAFEYKRSIGYYSGDVKCNLTLKNNRTGFLECDDGWKTDLSWEKRGFGGSIYLQPIKKIPIHLGYEAYGFLYIANGKLYTSDKPTEANTQDSTYFVVLQEK